MARLIVVSGAAASEAIEAREFDLGPLTTLGRHEGNTIQILDRLVSKEHAQIVRDDDGAYLLRDVGSRNGTYVAGQRITERRLSEGDEIVLGSTCLRFETAAPPPTVRDRVTFSSGRLDLASQIRQKVAPEEKEFLPERAIDDVDVLRRDYEKLRVGHELGRSVGLELDLDRLLEKILTKAFEVLRPDRGVMLLIDAKTGVPAPRVTKQKDGLTGDIVLSTTVVHEVTAHKAAVLSSDALIDRRFSGAQSIIAQGIRSTMTVPILYGDELLGIMHLDSLATSNAFTEKDLQIFTGIAAQAGVAIQNARMARRIEEDARVRAQFGRLLAPDLVDKVVSGQIPVERGGTVHPVTVLFADIRGFTAMSERSTAPEVVLMLNEFFEAMVDCVRRCGGTLDKYVGDEVMALFGSPLAPLPDAPLRAMRCALEMQRALRELNQTRMAERQEPIRIGVGINTGEVVCGMIGSSHTMQYTVIGDAVNTASRLCRLAYPGEIIVSEATLALAGSDVDALALPPVEVKGKVDRLRVFSVLGEKPADPTIEPA